jgi:ferredoxin-NADP reductase
VARAAVLGRLTWRVATVVAVRRENARAVTIVLDAPGWPGHLAGQHVDVRLTAEDGYQTQRSYSIASAPGGDRVELTVVEVDDGEVSEYLAKVLTAGDLLEVRGPVGGWFVWRPDAPGPFRPVMLVAGGSGLVPLMAMIRTRAESAIKVPFRLVYSATPGHCCTVRNWIACPARTAACTSPSPLPGQHRPGPPGAPGGSPRGCLRRPAGPQWTSRMCSSAARLALSSGPRTCWST